MDDSSFSTLQHQRFLPFLLEKQEVELYIRLVQEEGCKIFSGLAFFSSSFFFFLAFSSALKEFFVFIQLSHAVLSSFLKKIVCNEKKWFWTKVFLFFFSFLFFVFSSYIFFLVLFLIRTFLVNKLYQRFIVSSHEFELSSVYLGFLTLSLFRYFCCSKKTSLQLSFLHHTLVFVSCSRFYFHPTSLESPDKYFIF